MSTEITIRKATANDIAIIQNIAYETWPSTYGKIISPEQIEYMLEKMYNTTVLLDEMYAGTQFLIAEATETDPIGFASYNLTTNNIYKLNKLYVLPNTQHRGMGKKLLAEVVKQVVKLGGKELHLQVNRNNKAVGFYLKMGFEILESKDFDFGEGFFMNDYVMGIKL